MKRPQRLALGGVAGLAVAGAMGLLVFRLSLDAEALRPRLEERLSELFARPVRVGSLSFSFLGGFWAVAAGIEIAEPVSSDSGGAPTLNAEKAKIRLAVLPLLRKQVRVKSIRVEDAVVHLGRRVLLRDVNLRAALDRPEGRPLWSSGRMEASFAALPGEPHGEIRFTGTLLEDRLVLDAFSMRVGPGWLEATGEATEIQSPSPRLTLRVRCGIGDTQAQGTLATVVRGGMPGIAFDLSSEALDLDEVKLLAGIGSSLGEQSAANGSSLRRGGTWLGEAWIEGMLKAERATFAGLEFSRLATRVGYERGTLQLHDVGFELYGGIHAGELEIGGPGGLSPFRFRSRLSGVEVDGILGALDPPRREMLEGTADLVLELDGAAPAGRLDLSSLSGEGRVEIREGRLANVAMLRQVTSLLDAARGREIGRGDTPFDRLSATFRVASAVATTEDLEIRSEEMDLEGKGKVDLDGTLDLDLLVAFSPEVTSAMVSAVPGLRLRVEDTGRLTIPLELVGSLATPQVRVDVDRVVQEGIERVLEQKTRKDLIRRLVGGR